LRIEHGELRLADYEALLAAEADGIAAFRARQALAFDAERQRWIASGQAHFDSEAVVAETGDDAPLGDGQHAVESHIAGNLWQLRVSVGQRVAAGEVLAVLESMKMEISLESPCGGVVRELRVQPGATVRAGQCLVVIDAA
jgi:urea carboxylase